MREELTRYVQNLFAGTDVPNDIQQEILQNTLDRYDDLITQGKSPETAYELSIEGIGDINEITGISTPEASPSQSDNMSDGTAKLLRAIAIGLYILCPVPLFLGDGTTWGLCLTLVIIAIATALIVYAGKSKGNPEPTPVHKPANKLNPIWHGIIWGGGIPLYIILSLLTGAWHITWVLFPLLASIEGLATAIVDLKEACKHEN